MEDNIGNILFVHDTDPMNFINSYLSERYLHNFCYLLTITIDIFSNSTNASGSIFFKFEPIDFAKYDSSIKSPDKIKSAR